MFFSLFENKNSQFKEQKKWGENDKLLPFHRMFLFWKGASPNDTTSVTREAHFESTYISY